MAPDQSGPPILILYLIIFAIFWFVFLKPQNDEKKKRKNMLANLKKNDEVVTAGGIHGTVAIVKEKTVILRVDDNVRIEFDKESITSLTKSSES